MSEISPVLKLTLRKIQAEHIILPEFSIAGGTYYDIQSLELSCAVPGAQIYYTLDGSVPSLSSTLYSSPISITQSITVKARAFRDGMLGSRIASETYTLILGIPVPVATAATNRGAGTFRANWQQISGASCHLTVSRNPEFTDLLSGYSDRPVSGNSHLLINIALSTGKTFYYKLRCLVNGFYGDYSNTIQVQLGFASGGSVATYINPIDPSIMYWIHSFKSDDTFSLKANNFDYLFGYVIAGGGGGGGSHNGSGRPGGGGGAGDIFVISDNQAFIVDEIYTVQVGLGGGGGVNGQRGLRGHASRIYNADVNYIANGGGGGGAGLHSYSIYSDGFASNDAGNCGGGSSNGQGGQQSGQQSGGNGYEYSNTARAGGGGSDDNRGRHGSENGAGGDGSLIYQFGILNIIAGGGGSGGTINGIRVPGSVYGSQGAGAGQAAADGLDGSGAGGGGASPWFRNGGRGGNGAIYIIFLEII